MMVVTTHGTYYPYPTGKSENGYYKPYTRPNFAFLALSLVLVFALDPKKIKEKFFVKLYTIHSFQNSVELSKLCFKIHVSYLLTVDTCCDRDTNIKGTIRHNNHLRLTLRCKPDSEYPFTASTKAPCCFLM